jgi:hypothetical protein
MVVPLQLVEYTYWMFPKHLREGTYEFKFWADGIPVTSSLHDTRYDNFGYLNNVIEIVSGTFIFILLIFSSYNFRRDFILQEL